MSPFSRTLNSDHLPSGSPNGAASAYASHSYAPKGDLDGPPAEKLDTLRAGGRPLSLTDPRGQGVEDAAAAALGGLVICAITRRGGDSETKNPDFPRIPDTVPVGLVGHRWPSPEMVDAAAASFTHPLESWDGSEGPRARIEIGPGIIRIARVDLNRQEKRMERVQAKLRDRRRRGESMVDDLPEKTRSITAWSAKSRANMVATIASLDMREFVVSDLGMPAMVTLTLPGDWLTVAPTAESYRRMVDALRKRIERVWGVMLAALWKREFQRRGAPHTHIFMVVPYGEREGMLFADWLSLNWAQIVNHPDAGEYAKHLAAGTGVDYAEGLRSTDPRRIAVYFTKHSSANFGDKEYQHDVPEEWTDSAGRFWGYWRLEKATTYVELPLDDSIELARIARRLARAAGTTRAVSVWRLNESSGTYRRRKVRRRVKRMQGSSGFLCVNDGPSLAWELARYLDQGRAS